MRAFANNILILTVVAVALVSAEAGTIGQDLALDLPYGWTIISDTLTLPIHIVNDAKAAQLSIFRSEFNGPSVIRNNAELRTSVDRVVQEVILSLPESRLLTSTGFDRTDRAGFILEFVSRDTTANLDLRHRFEGVLYRLGSGNQALFTLWAKVPKEKYAEAESDIHAIQESFEFVGDKDASVYPPKVSPYLITFGLVMAAAVLLLVAYRRRARAASKKASDSTPEYLSHQRSHTPQR